MTALPRRLRSTGGESATARARRLAEVAVAGWRARGLPLELGDLGAFFELGYRTAVEDLVGGAS